MESPFLTLGQAAEYLGVDKRTVRRMVSRGDLALYKYGPRIARIRQDELDAVLRRIPAGGSS